MRDFTNVVRDNVSDYRGWFDIVRWAPIFTFVSAYVSDRIAREVGWSVIDEAWKGELPVREIARSVLEREQELLGDQGEEALRAAGLLGSDLASAQDPDSAASTETV